MSVFVCIPTPLRNLTGGESRIQGEGQDIKTLLADLETRFPGLQTRLCDSAGHIRRHINVYVNGEEIRSLQAERTSLEDGDEVILIPAMAGGARLKTLVKL